MSTELNDLLYGLNDNDEITLPSGKVAVIKEMTGAEQRNFMNRAQLNNGTAIQNLMGACVISLQGEPLPVEKDARTKMMLDLLASDRKALVFGIRRHSLGNEFMFSTQCPSCNVKGDWEVNLSDKAAFPIKPCPHGDERYAEYDSKVRSGLKIRFHMLDGNDEMAMLRKRDTIDLLTDLEIRKPHAWFVAEAQPKWVPISLNRLPDSLITEMRHMIRAEEGDVQTTVRVICPNCSVEVSFDLLQQQDFMIPSATS